MKTHAKITCNRRK